jgi:hypothetical protein
MLLKGIIVVYSDKRLKHINTFCGKYEVILINLILWRVDPLLVKDREINSYTTAVAW